MYLLILFHCNLVYVFLSFDWINTIIITIVSVHVFAFRVHEHKSRINKDGAFWCNAFFHVVHGVTYAENVERKVEARFRVVQVNPESTERPLP